jgi:hypothetical protein
VAIGSLSPNSVLASPVQANPQVKTDQQTSVPQVAQDAQKTAKTAQTDTITISAQALKMADDKNVVAKEAAKKDNEQREAQSARDESAAAEKNTIQRNALKAYALDGSSQ